MPDSPVRTHARRLLCCEAVTTGPAAALTRYDAYRRKLRHELGTDPGAGLRAVHQELLHSEAPVVRHGVPHEPNPLVGRDDAIAVVAELLTSRVVSIVGSGGLGKTRLAHVISRDAQQRVVHFVPLAGVTAHDDVEREVASAIGVGEARHRRHRPPHRRRCRDAQCVTRPRSRISDDAGERSAAGRGRGLDLQQFIRNRIVRNCEIRTRTM